MSGTTKSFKILNSGGQGEENFEFKVSVTCNFLIVSSTFSTKIAINYRKRRRRHVLFLLDGSTNGIVCEPILCCCCPARVPCASAGVCALRAAAVHIL